MEPKISEDKRQEEKEGNYITYCYYKKDMQKNQIEILRGQTKTTIIYIQGQTDCTWSIGGGTNVIIHYWRYGGQISKNI